MKKSILIPLVGVCVGSLLFALPARSADLDEKGLQQAMKDIGKTSRSFKKNMDDKNAVEMEKAASTVAALNHQAIAFWKGRKVEDAAKWSEESATAAKVAAVAAKAGDWDKVRANIQTVQKNCKNCHDAHREKVEENVYKIK